MFSKSKVKLKQDTLKSTTSRFLDTKRDGISRTKCLKFVLEQLGSDAERKRFMEDNVAAVFDVFYDLFLQAQSTFAKASKTSHSELEASLWVLEAIFGWLPEHVSQRWQYFSILETIKCCLHPGNVGGLRRLGVKYFLTWYQILSLGPFDSSCIELSVFFPVLVPHLTVDGRNSEEILRQICENYSATANEGVLCRLSCALMLPSSGSEPKKEVAIASFVDKIFEYVAKEPMRIKWTNLENQERCFTLLFDKVVSVYLPIFVPNCHVIDIYAAREWSLFWTIGSDFSTKCTVPVMEEANPMLEAGKHAIIRWFVSYIYSYKRQSDSFERAQTLVPPTQSNQNQPYDRMPPNFELVRRLLLSSRRRINLIMTVLRETMQLSFRYANTIAKALRVFREWIQFIDPLVFVLEPSPNENPLVTLSVGTQRTFRLVIKMSAEFFFNPHLLSRTDSPDEFIEEKIELAKRVLGLIRHAVMTVAMTQETWLRLLDVLRRITVQCLSLQPPANVNTFAYRISSVLLQTNETNFRNHEKYEAPLPGLEPTVIVTWVRANLTVFVPLDMWEQLQACVSQLTAWPELVEEWGKTLNSLTRTLSMRVHGVDLSLQTTDNMSSERTRLKRQQAIAEAGGASHVLRRSVTTDSNENEASSPTTTLFAHRWSLRDVSSKSVPVSATTTGGLSSEQRQSQPQVVLPTISEVERPPILKLSDAAPPMQAPSISSTSSGKHSAQDLLNEPETNIGDTSSTEGISLDAEVSSLDSCSVDIKQDLTTLDKATSAYERESMTPSPDLDECDGENFDNYDNQSIPADVQDLEHRSIISGGTCPGWFPDVSVILWKRVLGLLGNVNEIKVPAVHALAMEKLTEVIDMLIQVQACQDILTPAAADKNVIQYVPHLTFALPLLFQTFSLPSRYLSGKLLAVDLLCKVTLRRHTTPLSEDECVQFIAVVHKLLNASNNSEMIERTVCACSKLFYFDLKLGVPLVEDFLRAITNVISAPSATGPSKPCKLEAVLMCGVLTGLSNVICSMNIEVLRSDTATIASSKLGSEFKKNAVAALIQAAQDSDCSLRTAAMKVLTTFLYEETTKAGFPLSKTKENVEENNLCSSVLTVLLSLLQGSVDVQLYVDCLQALVNLLPFLSQDYSMPLRILEAYCDLLLSILSTWNVQKHSSLASSLLICVCEWCILLQSQCFISDALGCKVFDSVVQVIRDYLVAFYSEDQNSKPLMPALKTAYALLLESFGQWPLSEGGSAQENSTVCERLFQQLSTAAPPVNSDDSLCHTQCTALGNDLLITMETGGSKSLKNIDAKYGMASLTSLAENEVCALDMRLFSRRLSGKHCWKLKNIIHAASPETSNAMDWTEILEDMEKSEKKNDDRKSSSSSFGSVSFSSAKPTDVITQALDLVGKTSPECAASPGQSLNSIAPCPPGLVEAEEAMSAALAQFRLDASSSDGPSKPMSSEAPSLPVFNPSTFEPCRRLACALNLLNYPSSAEKPILQKSDRLLRELKHLDSRACKEAHKFAVVYVAEGQEDKQSILKNTCGSTKFESFVAALGWEVDLTTHFGYMGGLPAVGSSVYYSTPVLEVMYHVSTRLCSEDMNKKLRHIGNDEVQIVWSEHWRDYLRNIIATEFCDVLIVIYPMPNVDLYRVHINRKQEVGDFGPLYDGAMVSWAALPGLIRATAINASRAKRQTIPFFTQFYAERLSTLNSCAENLKQNLAFRSYASQWLLPPDPLESSTHQAQRNIAAAEYTEEEVYQV